MTRFLDGPAMPAILSLKYSPAWLRVVRNKAGEWDALDNPKDAPAHDETIYVYRLKEFKGRCHVSRRPSSLSGFFAIQDYVYHSDQPSEETMRDSVAWREWTKKRTTTLANGIEMPLWEENPFPSSATLDPETECENCGATVSLSQTHSCEKCHATLCVSCICENCPEEK